MSTNRCSRDDPLKAMNVNNVFEVKCPRCGEDVEFIGDEKSVRCDGCSERVPNPRLAAEEAG